MQITTLIPAYRTQYLPQLLHGLLHQSVRPYKVIFSDDSPDQCFAQALASPALAGAAAQLDISVVPGPRAGAFANWRHVLDVFGGSTEFFHMLCDDDVIYPGFYARHLAAHGLGDFGVTISRRWTANEAGQPLRDLPVPPAVALGGNALVTLDAAVLFYATCARGTNWLGEVSNAVYRADCASLIGDPQVEGIAYLGLEDIGSFLCSTLRQPACFINDHLGYFRTSDNQSSSQHYGRPLKLAHLAYIGLSLIGRNAGHLTQQHLLHCVHQVGGSVLHHYGNQADLQDCCGVLREWIGGDAGAEQRFLQVWRDYADYPVR